jgi:hypothetical protein
MQCKKKASISSSNIVRLIEICVLYLTNKIRYLRVLSNHRLKAKFDEMEKRKDYRIEPHNSLFSVLVIAYDRMTVSSSMCNDKANTDVWCEKRLRREVSTFLHQYNTSAIRS